MPLTSPSDVIPSLCAGAWPCSALPQSLELSGGLAKHVVVRRARRSQGFALCSCAGTALQLPHHRVPLLWMLPGSLSPSSSQRCHPWPSSPLSVRLPERGDSGAIVTELPCQAACVAAGRGGGTSCWRGLAAAGFCSALRSWKSSQVGATAAVTLHRGGRDPPFLLAVSPPAFPVPAVPPSAFVAQPQQTQLLPKPPREPVCSLLPGASLCRAARAVRSISLCWGLPLGSPDVLQFPWLFPPCLLPAGLVEIPAEGILQGYF